MITHLIHKLRHRPRSHSHTEALIASFGAFLSITVIYYIMLELTLPSNTLLLLAASTGSTALMMFSWPKSEFSHAWSALAGHTISGCIGVSCFQLLGDSFLASALSVSLALVFMHMLKCLHPPAGATALLAVIGGEQVTRLGFSFVLFPIFSNILLLVIVAQILNGLILPRLHALKIRQAPQAEQEN